MINIVKAKKLIDKGAVLIDIRSPVNFAAGSLPNAINLTLRNISLLMKYDRSKTIVFFGNSDTDENLNIAVSYALQMGFEAHHFGSIENWK